MIKPVCKNFKRGASLAVALIIFLVCALAGSLALATASANAGRYAGGKRDGQSYYTVTSAALLLADIFDGMEYGLDNVVFFETQPAEDGQDYACGLNIFKRGTLPQDGITDLSECGRTFGIPHAADESPRLYAAREDMAASSMAELIGLRCDSLAPRLSIPQEWYERMGGNPYEGSPTPDAVVQNFTVGAEGLEEVTVSLQMEGSYNLTFLLAAGGGEPYAVKMYWEATVEEDVQTSRGGQTGETVTRTKSLKVKWEKKNITMSRTEI